MRHRQQRNNQILAEKDFQRQVLELAAVYGWLAFHVPDSRRVSCRGCPDTLLLHPQKQRFLIRELKVAGGKLTREQITWLDGLLNCGIDAGVWFPHQWDDIVRTLST